MVGSISKRLIWNKFYSGFFNWTWVLDTLLVIIHSISVYLFEQICLHTYLEAKKNAGYHHHLGLRIFHQNVTCSILYMVNQSFAFCTHFSAPGRFYPLVSPSIGVSCWMRSSFSPPCVPYSILKPACNFFEVFFSWEAWEDCVGFLLNIHIDPPFFIVFTIPFFLFLTTFGLLRSVFVPFPPSTLLLFILQVGVLSLGFCGVWFKRWKKKSVWRKWFFGISGISGFSSILWYSVYFFGIYSAQFWDIHFYSSLGLYSAQFFWDYSV